MAYLTTSTKSSGMFTSNGILIMHLVKLRCKKPTFGSLKWLQTWQAGTEPVPQKVQSQKQLWSFSRPSHYLNGVCIYISTILSSVKFVQISTPDRVDIVSFPKYVVPLCTVNTDSYISIDRSVCPCFSLVRLSTHQLHLAHILGQISLTTILLFTGVCGCDKTAGYKIYFHSNLDWQMHTQHWICLFWVATDLLHYFSCWIYCVG